MKAIFRPARLISLPVTLLALVTAIARGQNPAQPAPGIPPAAPTNPPPPLALLAWNAETLEAAPKEGDTEAFFTFWFTNMAKSDFVITDARSFCFCTVPTLPSKPWRIGPGSNDQIKVKMDLRGKFGPVQKEVVIDTTSGTKQLLVKANISSAVPPPGFAVTPARSEAERVAGMSKALVDRQVVFRDANCATCHATPAHNQTDALVIYTGVCGVCHDSKNRAPAVTDLRALKNETDLDYWKYWITNGREGTMMPAFALAQGGPLTDLQIETLAAWCVKNFQPAPAGATNTIPSRPASTK